MVTAGASTSLPRSRGLARPGGVLRYIDEGDGPAVVCVHGNPTWSWYYRRLVRALTPDHRVVVPDHLGMGRSDAPPADRYAYDLQARVADFDALMDHLAVGIDTPATLVVHDWGGPIGLAWATRHPDRVGRLIVCNTAAFPMLNGHGLPWPLRPARVPVLGEVLVCGANAFVRGALRYGVHRRRMSRAVRSAYLEPYDSWRRRVGVLRFVRDVPAGPGTRTFDIVRETGATLHTLADRPALVLWGMRDPVLTPLYLEEWRHRLPDAEIHAIADAGHLVLEDAPETVPVIAAFLSRTRAAVETR